MCRAISYVKPLSMGGEDDVLIGFGGRFLLVVIYNYVPMESN